MKNPATDPKYELNDFTNNIRVIARNLWEGNYWVQLRNGELVRPVFIPAKYDGGADCFATEQYRWKLDGTSMTRSRHDMMEIVKKEG